MHRLLTAAVALAASSTAAFAHPGGPVHDLTHGFLHPISGLDHVLAMVAVGVLAAQLAGRALWLLPAVFIAVMAAAAAFGVAGVAPPYAELGIAASVLVLGAVIALRFGMPTSLAVLMVGIFAVFHGVAHGAEMPATIFGLAYGAGFVVATALLHVIGIGAAFVARALGEPLGGYAVRSLGAIVGVIGVMLVATSALA